MEKNLISIIVPVYNVEKYLGRCIDSIINQSYRNLEIILVDDGSTDDSGKICDEYAKVDNRIKVLHSINQGQSLARTKGIDIAEGEYISFVDSDDVININMYQLFLNHIISNNADMCICKYKKFDDKNYIEIIKESQIDRIVDIKNIKIVNNEYALKKCLSTKKFTVSLWCKLYKKKIFDNLEFPKGSEMEDWAVIVDIMLRCRKVVLIDNYLYYYYQRNNSTMHSHFKEKDLFLDKIFIRNLKLIDEFFPRLHNQAKTNLTANYFYVVDKMIKSKKTCDYDKEFNQLLLRLKKEFVFILFHSKHKVLRKVLYVILIINKDYYIKLISTL